jgi:predicted metal-dependent HD superfamily phosphohydrolase
MKHPLLPRWMALSSRLGIESAGQHFQMLVIRYCEPHRHYHSLLHIAECLDWFDHFQGQFADPLAAEFALWLHDVVYEPLSKENELQSARLALRMLPAMSELQESVRAMILATRHLPEELSADGSLIADTDMLILAAVPDRYDLYAADVRREYSVVSDEDFKAGRVQFIRSLLGRPSIYRTLSVRKQFEVGARTNLDRELIMWS